MAQHCPGFIPSEMSEQLIEKKEEEIFIRSFATNDSLDVAYTHSPILFCVNLYIKE